MWDHHQLCFQQNIYLLQGFAGYGVPVDFWGLMGWAGAGPRFAHSINSVEMSVTSTVDVLGY